jgi:hypothetical protein
MFYLLPKKIKSTGIIFLSMNIRFLENINLPFCRLANFMTVQKSGMKTLYSPQNFILKVAGESIEKNRKKMKNAQKRCHGNFTKIKLKR